MALMSKLDSLYADAGSQGGSILPRRQRSVQYKLLETELRYKCLRTPSILKNQRPFCLDLMLFLT